MTVAQVIGPGRLTLGEGLVHDRIGHALIYVDIEGRTVHRHALASGLNQHWSAPEGLTSLDLTAQGRLIGTSREALVAIALDPTADTARLDTLVRPTLWDRRLRFNDGAFAPDGAYWAGFMHNAETETCGGWWRFGDDRPPERLGGDVHVANGPVFDAGRGLAYLTDSARAVIWVCDGWTPEAYWQRRVFKSFDPATQGYPDGMALDGDGRLWVAFWDGGCVRVFDPEGRLTDQMDLPVLRPTKPALVTDAAGLWLYLTSARTGLEDRGPDAADGALIRLGPL